MSEIVVSVVMSVYKEPTEWLRQSIDSILNQTFRDFEFIIICDNPLYTEGIELLKQYADCDKRIVLIFNDKNFGLTKSLNKGISLSRGRYIARMDADDVSLLTRLEKQVYFMEAHPEKDLCHTNYAYIDELSIIKCERVSNPDLSTQDFLFWHNVIAHPTVIFRNKLLTLRTPLYNEEIKIGQDYELWAILTLANAEVGFLDEVLLNYRKSQNQISSQKLEEQHNNTLKIRKKLILSYLKRRGIVQEVERQYIKKIFNNLKLYLESNKANNENEIRNLQRIQYILYYTLACNDSKYVAKFLLDRNMRQMSANYKDIARVAIAPILGWKYRTMKFE